jgi:hypothetical protein
MVGGVRILPIGIGTSHPKEDVLWIFIAFKKPSPWPDFDP